MVYFADMSENRHLRLFWEFFKTSLFVVGGGYAIAAVANERFGKKLRWLKEDEILDNLSLISSIPGLIAGNTAIYTGLKTAGRAGAAIALFAVALPSIAIFTAVSYGFAAIPADNAYIEGAFLGLRSSLTAVVAITMYSTLKRKTPDIGDGVGVGLKPLTRTRRILSLAAFFAVLAAIAVFYWKILAVFLGFGTICIGGGFPLVPFYSRVFVGPDAPLIAMEAEQFSNLMALTQMTPGPVSVNAATFFGFLMGGVTGGVIATAALLTPSYFMMTAALNALSKLKKSSSAKFVFGTMKPVALTLMGIALWKFATMSVIEISPESSISVNLYASGIFLAACIMLKRFKISVMATVALSAIAGLLSGI